MITRGAGNSFSGIDRPRRSSVSAVHRHRVRPVAGERGVLPGRPPFHEL